MSGHPVLQDDVFIGLGSNLGDSSTILLRAWEFLGQQDDITTMSLSAPFFSAPVKMSSNHWFTNAVGHLSTSLSAHSLLDTLLETERILGRIRDGKKVGYQDRVIDLDLLYYGSLIHDDPRLTTPHPYLTDRLFVLEPMLDVAPEFIDPVVNISVVELHRILHRKIESGEIEKQEISRGRWPEAE